MSNRFALVKDGRIANIVVGDNMNFEVPDGVVVMVCPDGAGIADAVENGFWTAPELRAPNRDELLDISAHHRRVAVNRGAIIDGIPTWTDSTTQGVATSLVLACQIDPTFKTDWKGRDGLFYPLDAAGIVRLATGIMTFVAAAFAIERDLISKILAGEVSRISEVDEAYASL